MTTTYEDYLAWVEAEAPKYLARAKSMWSQDVEPRMVEGWQGSVWWSDSINNALWADLWSIARYGHLDLKQRPYALERLIQKRRRAAAKVAETKRRTAARLGPGRTKSGQPRDSQRQKVYDSEDVLGPVEWPGQEHFVTVSEMQSYVDRLIASAWFQRRWKIRAVEVRDGRGRRSAASNDRGGYITMPVGMRYEEVVLHEIAHQIVGRTIGHRNVQAHGREFCQVLLELVGHKLGADAKRALKSEFQRRKVKHTKARKPMGAEQRAAAAERLAVARAAKAIG